MYHLKHSNIVCLLDFELVGEKKECTGSEENQGYLRTINLCYNACKGKASMFIYGLAPDRCNGDGCKCICETSSKDGQCTMKDQPVYNLYAYTVVKKGEIVIIRTIFYTKRLCWFTVARIDQVCQ